MLRALYMANSPGASPHAAEDAQATVIYQHLIARGQVAQLHVKARRLRELLLDIPHKAADVAMGSRQICTTICALDHALERIGRYPRIIPEHIEVTDKVRRTYIEAAGIRDTLVVRWLGVANSLQQALRSDDRTPLDVDFFYQSLILLKDLFLIVWIGIRHPRSLAEYWNTVPEKAPTGPGEWKYSDAFHNMHRDVLNIVHQLWARDLKGRARSMITRGAHIELSRWNNVPVHIKDSLFDQLLFSFMDTKKEIDELGETISRCKNNPRNTNIMDHLEIDSLMQKAMIESAKFRNALIDKSVYKKLAKNVVSQGYASLGDYLVKSYIASQAGSDDPANRQVLSHSQASRLSYTIDHSVDALPDPPEKGVELIKRIERKYKLKARVACRSRKYIDARLYHSNMDYDEREKLRRSTVIMRILPLHTHVRYELECLKVPEVRYLAYLKVTESAVKRQEMWLKEMQKQVSWARSVVKQESTRAGPLVLTEEEKAKARAGTVNACLNKGKTQPQADAVEGGGFLSEMNLTHTDTVVKHDKSKKKKAAGKKNR